MVENKIITKNDIDNKTLFYLESFGFCMARENREGMLVLYNKSCYNQYCFNNNIYISAIDDYNDDWIQNFSNLYDVKWIKQCSTEAELMYCVINETYFLPIDWENPYSPVEIQRNSIILNEDLESRQHMVLFGEARHN